MTSPIKEFREAVSALHRAKNTAYRNSWKKRGEVLSILANIARKVDRLENVIQGSPTTQEESLVETAVDLFVYCLKYQTFLADLDVSLAESLFGGSGVRGPYSEGTAGFQHLLAQTNLGALGEVVNLTTTEGVTNVLKCFERLESRFSGISTSHSFAVRSGDVQGLLESTIGLISTLRREYKSIYDGFLLSSRAGRGVL